MSLQTEEGSKASGASGDATRSAGSSGRGQTGVPIPLGTRASPPSRMRDLAWEPCALERGSSDAELERYVRERLGFVPPPFRYLFDCPWLVRAEADLSVAKLIHIDKDLEWLIAAVVAHDNSCRFCFANAAVQLRVLGYSAEQVERLEDNLLTAELESKSRLAIEFARRVSRCNPWPTEKDKAALIDGGYDSEGVRELIFICATSVFFNRATTLPALPPYNAERLPDRWWMKLLGPIIGAFLRRSSKGGVRRPLTAEEREGPFAGHVEAFEPLPAAIALRRIIDDAWNSPLLPRRTKGLIFAVVARAIGCPVSEAEAVRLLELEGLPPDSTRRVLENLASPDLDRAEAAVVPFARETVWYQPASIQRRARRVRELLSQAQFLEVIGIVALANAVCRMSVALPED